MQDVLATIEIYDAERKHGQLILDPDVVLNAELQSVNRTLFMDPGAFVENLYFEKGQRVRCEVGKSRSGVLVAIDVRPYSF